MNHKIKNLVKKWLFTNETGYKYYSAIANKVREKRSMLSDREYVERSFLENTGVRLNLDKPETFNDKLLWLSLYDRDHMKTQCADKYSVRAYIDKCGFGYILNELYGVFNSVNEIDFSVLPERFFIKTNHDSGTYALIDQSNPDSLNKLNKIEQALKRNYYYESREWQYRDISPKLVCEKYLESNEPIGLIDYRFFCFGGAVGFVAVDIGTTDPCGKHSFIAKRNIYDKSLNLLSAKLKREPFDASIIRKPIIYDDMVYIAEALSKPFKHVRVDLYNVNGNIIFGEMTFCNGGGMQLLEPASFNREMGNLINIEGVNGGRNEAKSHT